MVVEAGSETPDLSALDARERAEWDRYLARVRAGEGPTITRAEQERFLAIKERVKWVTVDRPGVTVRARDGYVVK